LNDKLAGVIVLIMHRLQEDSCRLLVCERKAGVGAGNTPETGDAVG
jgi:hypothetical protein